MKTSVKLFVVAAAAFMVSAMADSLQVGDPSGVQIQGNTDISATADSVNTMSSGSNSVATAKIGGISGGTQIQGNTTINVSAKNVNTTASGATAKACSEVGTIGDTAGCTK